MNPKDMDCVTMSYLLGVILIGFGLFTALLRQFNLRSGSIIGRSDRIHSWGEEEKYNHIPGGKLEGWDAFVMGILMILLGAYLLLNPGPLLAAFKVCTVP
jgi:hypothetical protein